MSMRDKYLDHVAAAEYWNERVDDMEAAAIRVAGRKQDKRSTAAGLPTDLVARKLLVDHSGYSAAVAARNSHQRRATMYGLGALLSAITDLQQALERTSR